MFRRVAVAGRSMEPALRDGDWILVTAAPGLPKVGHIVLARDPRVPDRLVLKRVAAIGGAGYTLVGDRPETSTDSREYGPVGREHILGRAIFRYSPVRRVGWL